MNIFQSVSAFLVNKKTYIAAVIAIAYGVSVKDWPLVLQGLMALCGRAAIAKVQAAIAVVNTVSNSTVSNEQGQPKV